jgi:hypothetical protein
MSSSLLFASAVFAALAIFAPDIFRSLSQRRRIAPPHRHLLLVFRIWFGLLAAATVWLIFHQPHPR